jgi:uncharacterized protein YcfJ
MTAQRGNYVMKRKMITCIAGAALVLWSLAVPPAAVAGPVGGGIGGAILGGIIGDIVGGRDGAAWGATIGAGVGISKGAKKQERRRQAEAEQREWQRQRRMDEERMRYERDQAMREQRYTQRARYVEPAQPVAPAGGGDTALVSEVQRSLIRLGYDPGRVGVMSTQTTAAVKGYQQSHGLLATGQLSHELLRHMILNGG